MLRYHTHLLTLIVCNSSSTTQWPADTVGMGADTAQTFLSLMESMKHNLSVSLKADVHGGILYLCSISENQQVFSNHFFIEGTAFALCCCSQL